MTPVPQCRGCDDVEDFFAYRFKIFLISSLFKTKSLLIASTLAPSIFAMALAAGDPLFFVARYCPKKASPMPIPNEAICLGASGTFKDNREPKASDAVSLIQPHALSPPW
jgi:hypothetical protein